MELQNFESIYQNTYDNTLKFIVVKCNNIDEKDIIDKYKKIITKFQLKNMKILN